MPFTKGDPNINRKGSPKGKRRVHLTSLLKKELEKIPEGKKETYKILFVQKILKLGIIDGDIQALKLVMNYVDGLPKETIDLNVNVSEERRRIKKLEAILKEDAKQITEGTG